MRQDCQETEWLHGTCGGAHIYPVGSQEDVGLGFTVALGQ